MKIFKQFCRFLQNLKKNYKSWLLDRKAKKRLIQNK